MPDVEGYTEWEWERKPGTPTSSNVHSPNEQNSLYFTHLCGDMSILNTIEPWPHRPCINLSKRIKAAGISMTLGPEEDFPFWPNCGAAYLGIAFRTGPAGSLGLI